MKTYRLGSTPLISAPGIVVWAINGYAFKADRKNLVRVIRDGWKVPEEAAVALLSGAAVYEISDEVVVFTA